MRLLITGSESPLGRLAADALRVRHEVVLTDASPTSEAVHQVDLRDPDRVAELLAGVDAILHLAPFERATPSCPADEAQVLDHAATGTFVLLQAAKAAGVRRLVLASRLELFDAHPANYRVDETWEPRPAADAASLAPWLAELTVREFVRAEELLAVCLRFGVLGDGPLGDGIAGTTPEDAISALERTLAFDPAPSLHRWWLYHVCSNHRYVSEALTQHP